MKKVFVLMSLVVMVALFSACVTSASGSMSQLPAANAMPTDRGGSERGPITIEEYTTETGAIISLEETEPGKHEAAVEVPDQGTVDANLLEVTTIALKVLEKSDSKCDSLNIIFKFPGEEYAFAAATYFDRGEGLQFYDSGGFTLYGFMFADDEYAARHRELIEISKSKLRAGG